jgi:uncharacterized protein YbbK (DUF523 family)
MMHKILVSSCLLGQPVRYNGTARLSGHPLLLRWIDEGRAVPICPEVAAGFPTPRPAAEIADARQGQEVWGGSAQVVEQDGTDVTELYRLAGQCALDLARSNACRFAALTDGSPSCGASFIYDGSFTGKRHFGQGTTAALLQINGIAVYPETQIEALDDLLSELECNGEFRA